MAHAISEEKLVSMKPHEELLAGHKIKMIRVVGGWIYWKEVVARSGEPEGTSGSVSIALTGVFVPEPK